MRNQIQDSVVDFIKSSGRNLLTSDEVARSLGVGNGNASSALLGACKKGRMARTIRQRASGRPIFMYFIPSKGSTKDIVFQVVKESGGDLTSTEICKCMPGYNRSTVKNALTQLSTAGKIGRFKDGDIFLYFYEEAKPSLRMKPTIKEDTDDISNFLDNCELNIDCDSVCELSDEKLDKSLNRILVVMPILSALSTKMTQEKLERIYNKSFTSYELMQKLKEKLLEEELEEAV